MDILIQQEKNNMTTIYSLTADGQERYDTVRQERVAEVIKRLKNSGAIKVQVITYENPEKWVISNGTV